MGETCKPALILRSHFVTVKHSRFRGGQGKISPLLENGFALRDP